MDHHRDEEIVGADHHEAEHQADHKGEGNLQHVAVHQAEQQRRHQQRHAVAVGAQRLQHIAAEHHFFQEGRQHAEDQDVEHQADRIRLHQIGHFRLRNPEILKIGHDIAGDEVRQDTDGHPQKDKAEEHPGTHPLPRPERVDVAAADQRHERHGEPHGNGVHQHVGYQIGVLGQAEIGSLLPGERRGGDDAE